MNMFNIQRKIFTMAAEAVLASYPSCRIANAFIYAPEKFPCVSIVLSDDGTTDRMRDSSRADNFRDVTVTVDVYTNKAEGKKTEAEDIMQIIIKEYIQWMQMGYLLLQHTLHQPEIQ